MSRDKLSARDKKVQKMSRDGLVERNVTSGDEKRVSMRGAEFLLRDNPLDDQSFSQLGTSSDPTMRKKRIQRRYHRPVLSQDDAGPQISPARGMPQKPHTQTGKAVPVSETPLNMPPPDNPTRDLREQPGVSGRLRPKENTELRHDQRSPLLHEPSEPGGTAIPSQEKAPDGEHGRPIRPKRPAESAQAVPGDNTAPPPKPDKPGKLKFTPEESPPQPEKGRKHRKAECKYERAVKKLDAAQDNLPTKRKARIDRVFDEDSGTSRRKLRFENEVISQSEHVKGSLPMRPLKAGINMGIGYAHRKLLQVEHENVGIKAAHKTELAAETGLRSALRFRKTAPYRKVRKLERRARKKSVKLAYQRALTENPKLRSNMFSRYMQKRKIKRQYAKAARETRKMAARAKRAGTLTAKAGRAIVNIIFRNPKVIIGIALAALLFIAIMSLVGLFSNLGDAGLRGILTASYLAENEDINSVSSAYTEWETDLRLQIENVETDFPGFDEYRFYIDEIGHDPHVLMAYLTIIYQNFPFDAIVGELRALFDEQYTLAFEQSMEIRYYINDDGEEVPYEWHILTVRLVVRPLEEIIAERLSEEQLQHFEILMESRGGRQFAGSPFAFDWLPFVSSHFGWRIDPFTGQRAFHTGVDIAVSTGTPIIAAHDGTVIATVWGTTGYGRYILLDGGNGLVTRYAHCDMLLVSVGQHVMQGEIIATSGSTGNSTGPHLHFEVILNGQYMNPVFFAQLSV